jgi:hypothetical protein
MVCHTLNECHVAKVRSITIRGSDVQRTTTQTNTDQPGTGTTPLAIRYAGAAHEVRRVCTPVEEVEEEGVGMSLRYGQYKDPFTKDVE